MSVATAESSHLMQLAKFVLPVAKSLCTLNRTYSLT